MVDAQLGQSIRPILREAMSEKLYVIRRANGHLVYSLLTHDRPMVLSKSLAEETRADLDFEDRKNAPHRIEALPTTDRP
jgi:hypothetical protein